MAPGCDFFGQNRGNLPFPDGIVHAEHFRDTQAGTAEMGEVSAPRMAIQSRRKTIHTMTFMASQMISLGLFA